MTQYFNYLSGEIYIEIYVEMPRDNTQTVKYLTNNFGC